jgi:lipopolysaccharide transport system ATP-binding protein
MTTVISVENLSKAYRLGQIGTGTFTYDLALWWARLRGKPNPLMRIGETDQSNRDGETLWALKDVSFTVEQGEVLGIIGRNGAGKSTLLKILSRVTAPTSGRIKVKGRVASLLEVGTGFHPELTGRENIYLNGALLGMSRREIDRKFDEIVDFAEVEKFIETPVKRYSSGMYVRLAFAVAAHLEPEILVVDEVLAVGDLEFQKKCLGKMGKVAESGRTVLFVSHNMVAVQELCERCLWLHSGQQRSIGKALDIIHAYSGQLLNQAQSAALSEKMYRGDGKIKLVSYQVLNANKEAHPLPTTNQDVLVRVKTCATEPIQKVACGISIRNDRGVLMTSINTVEQGKTFPSIPEGESDILIKLGKVSFLPGDYLVSFWIMNPNGHIYVMGEDILTFRIEQSPIYGTRHIDHRWGCVFTDVDFSIDFQNV